MSYLLAADIGGTNSRFALFRLPTISPPDWQQLSLVSEYWYLACDYESFQSVLEDLAVRLNADGYQPRLRHPGIQAAVIAPAGPITGASCKISNLPWTVTTRDVQRILHIPTVTLINDFVAQGYATLLPFSTTETINVRTGKSIAKAPCAITGAGTGFGKALLIPGNPPHVFPSEGGHVNFPFLTHDEQEFGKFLRTQTGMSTPVYDTVVTGSGLGYLFTFLTGKTIQQTEVPALLPQYPTVFEWFARFYGRACRNYVLDTLSLGGLYISGGIASRVAILQHDAFWESFHDNAIQEPLLRGIPVWHMQSQQAGLWGAAAYGALYANCQ